MFVLTCSPFLLNSTKRGYVEKHLVENIEKLLLQFLGDLYADDTATSFNESNRIFRIFSILTKNILTSEGFNLGK